MNANRSIRVLLSVPFGPMNMANGGKSVNVKSSKTPKFFNRISVILMGLTLAAADLIDRPMP